MKVAPYMVILAVDSATVVLKAPEQPISATRIPGWVKPYIQSDKTALTSQIKPPKRITILIIEPQEMLREGLKFLLLQHNRLQIIGESCSGLDGLEAASSLEPAIVIFDAQLPDMTALSFLKQLTCLARIPMTLALGRGSDLDKLKDLLNLGLVGFVDKESNASLLINAILSIAQGVQFIPSNWHATSKTEADSNLKAKFQFLSKREIEVLRLLLTHQRYNQIANTLCISPRTLETHVCRIFEKLEVSSRIALTLEADTINYLIEQHLNNN